MPDGALTGRDLVLSALDELLRELPAAEGWENPDLDRYLEAFAALLGSIENAYAYARRPVPQDPWQLVAEVTRGARWYE
ncbi:DUF7660 family protein [Cellulomonas dongxiuzhuiae]|uniref:DUF7660 domain-containing protein n=1 Tax=Cellulomonas dongxiuzhuiae TaxID=2819979 RepID=A0ABX8GIZ5_9CELL|nr:hypothetical protein [Cellulomonas dongxiuzhuiae]MBO3094972.1 hypothetical protein [Cellulomonas dongxiuzhuiae]QWC15990.1 hypothetical protein KKR89_17395 [Cellulomonas dongxiuzhuiae]